MEFTGEEKQLLMTALGLACDKHKAMYKAVAPNDKLRTKRKKYNFQQLTEYTNLRRKIDEE